MKRILFILLPILAVGALGVMLAGGETPAPRPNATPADAATQGGAKMLQEATFGAGCFWGVEATFQQAPGVVETAVGYMGGTTKNPTYKQVCTDRTGHAEVVHIKYDPAKVSYEQLLKIFWENHDPTQLNRQGPDVGDQYRSVIFTYTPEQEAAARKSKEEIEKSAVFGRPIATVIEPASDFWRAEEYHQKYLERRGLLKCR